jgi:diadenosine tetraphosphatase ApaH/serine/threonine PP2A family protein phosphatase
LLIALFADIHANRQAFEACLAGAKEQGAEQYVLLGDFVGYGADPDWVTTTVMEMVGAGAVAVMGNHDSAVGNPKVQLNPQAQAAMEWTRGELGLAQRQFLANLPMKEEQQSRLYVHADASRPESWTYVTDASVASRSMQATFAHVTFCGHIHRPALYSLSVTGKMTSFVPTSGVPVQLLPGRQWLVVVGSVGQPRDGNPAAAYALYNTDSREVTYCRVPYDVAEASARIRKNGLPIALADRLLAGR